MDKKFLVWAFSSLIYFKVIFDASFDDDLSIVASTILAVVTCFFLFFANSTYSKKVVASSKKAELSLNTIRSTVLYFLAYTAALTVTARLIIFGFSKNLNSEIDFYHQRYGVTDDLYPFILIMLVPTTIHYLRYLHALPAKEKEYIPIRADIYNALVERFKQFIDTKTSFLKKAESSLKLQGIMSRSYDILAIKMAYMVYAILARRYNTNFFSTQDYELLRTITLAKLTELYNAELLELSGSVKPRNSNPLIIASNELERCDIAVIQSIKRFIDSDTAPVDPIFKIIDHDLPLSSTIKTGEPASIHRDKFYAPIFREMTDIISTNSSAHDTN